MEKQTIYPSINKNINDLCSLSRAIIGPNIYYQNFKDILIYKIFRGRGDDEK